MRILELAILPKLVSAMSFRIFQNCKNKARQLKKRMCGKQLNCNAKEALKYDSKQKVATGMTPGRNDHPPDITTADKQCTQDPRADGQWANENNTDEISDLDRIKTKEQREMKEQLEKKLTSNVDETTENEISVSSPISLATIVDCIQQQIPVLDNMSVTNFEEILSTFQKTSEELISVSLKESRKFLDEAQLIESALNALAEYNKHAMQLLIKMTTDGILSVHAPSTMTPEQRLSASAAALRRAQLLTETADRQLEYSKQLGAIASPLTLWRLDASKAVWEAQRALKQAEKKHLEIKEMTTLYNALPATVPRKTSDVTLPDDDQLEQKRPQNTEVLPISRGSVPSKKSSTTEPETQEDSSGLAKDLQSPETSERKQRRQQPIKMWPKHTYFTTDGEIICYVRAPSDCLRKKENLVCSFSEPLAPWPPIPGHTESIGRLVSIEPIKNRKTVILPEEPWIIGIPHNYGKVASKETVLYMIEAGPKGVTALQDDLKNVKQTELVYWHDLNTTDVIAGENHFLEARLNQLTNVTFAPFTRLRRDRIDIGKHGGRLQSLTDPRVALTVPPEAIKVQQLDCRQVNAFKERNQALMADFIACSPMIYLTCARKLLFKPITVTLPVPEISIANRPTVSTTVMDRMDADTRIDTSSISEEASGPISNKASSKVVYDGFQKSLILPLLLAGSRTEVSEVVLMQKSESSGYKWVISKDAKLSETRADVSTFHFRRIETCRLLVLKMRRLADSETLSQCATYLEQSFSQHVAYISVRRHHKQPQQLCLLLSSLDQLESELHALAEEGYKEGDKPHGPMFLTEGQHLDIEFRSNIRPRQVDSPATEQAKQCMKIMFNSAVSNRKKITVEAIDTSAQVGLDEYRGFMDVYCMRELIVPVSQKRNGNIDALHEEWYPSPNVLKLKKSRFRQTTERTHLTRIVLRLPKQSTVLEPQAEQRAFHFEVRDCVDHKYLKELAKRLPSDTWKKLGLALDMSRGRIQAIGGKTRGGAEEQAYAMLISWIKTLPVSANRFTLLYHALQTIGRTDLALQLRDRGEENWDDEVTSSG
ncbi:unnamed protein product [Dicrocoelium dendriticum]|nr:unnamed protein product [Dicrocoelium dendriticum]